MLQKYYMNFTWQNKDYEYQFAIPFDWQYIFEITNSNRARI